jgi:hypothetical protein
MQFASPSADAHIQDAIRSARPSHMLVVTDDGDHPHRQEPRRAVRSGSWL